MENLKWKRGNFETDFQEVYIGKLVTYLGQYKLNC